VTVFDAIGLEPRFDLTERGRDDEHVERPSFGDPGTSLLLLRVQRYASSPDDSVTVLAPALRGVIPRDAALVRYRNDTVAILVPRAAGSRVLLALARRIISRLAHPITGTDGALFAIKPTIGVATAEHASCTIEQLAGRAEVALRRAASTPQGIAFYTPRLEREVRRRETIECHLRRAVSDETVSVVYQPIVSLATGRIVGAEALARWRCPELGPVPPLEFISIAEESGMIVPLGDSIMRQACTQMRRWEAAGFGGLRIAVNVSARQLQATKFARMVADVCEATGLRPTQLELEITERTIMGDGRTARRNLFALRSLGVSIAIDDFGTGYSSLSYLKTLPVDALKIDRSFVAAIVDDPFQADVARSVIWLAHRRALRVVGEGVETAAQREHLLAMGCDEAQGRLFSKPVSAKNFSAALTRGALATA
jgi:EAL domain-containing protein (putative c-di-GMP-specific phosphodiesterase class I)